MRPALLLLGASVVSLAGVATSSAEPLAGEPRRSAAVNPVFAAFGTLTVECELALPPRGLSIGASAWWEVADVKARWAYAKLLYYPGGAALRGFGVGLTAGVIRSYQAPDEPQLMEHDTAAMAGAMLQYNLILWDRLLLGAGVGGRVALTGITAGSPLQRVDGDVRLVVGITF